MDDQRGLTVLDRVSLIVIALVFYLAIRALQSAQDDINSIARHYADADRRLIEVEDDIAKIKRFIEE